MLSGSVRRQTPKFRPATWNVCAVTLQGGDRTNNHAEGWNNHLQHLIGHKHPSIWRLIEVLQADTAESATKILRHATGNLSPKRQSKKTASQHQLLSIVWRIYSGSSLIAVFCAPSGTAFASLHRDTEVTSLHRLLTFSVDLRTFTKA